MTDQADNAHSTPPATEPLALRLSEGLGVTRFAPSVVVDGRTVQPEGWMWVLSFALAGVPWAVEAASTDEFSDRCRAGLKAMRDREAESEIAHLERRIAVLKAGLTPNRD